MLLDWTADESYFVGSRPVFFIAGGFAFGPAVPEFAADICTTSILEMGRTHTIRSFGKSIGDLMTLHTIGDCPHG